MIEVPYFLLIPIMGIIILLVSNKQINKFLTIIGAFAIIPLALIPLSPHVSSINFLELNIQLINQDYLGYNITIVFTITLLIGTFFCLLYKKVNYKEIGLAFIIGGCAIIVASCLDLLVILMMLQIISIIIAIITAMGSQKKKASKSQAIGVAVVHLVGSLIFTIGVDAYASYYGTTQIVHTYMNNHYSSYIMLAGLLILIGTPPFCGWLVTALSSSSHRSALLLSIFTPKIALVVLVKMFAGFHILVYIGIWSTVIGLTATLFTTNLRKILLYAIIHEIGFMLTMLSLVNDSTSVFAITLLLFAHTLCEVFFFMISAICYQHLKTGDIEQMKGFFRCRPLMGILLLIVSLNSLGFPLTSSFVGKVLIFHNQNDGHEFVHYFAFFSAAAHALHVGFKLFYVLYIERPDAKNVKHFTKIQINPLHILLASVLAVALVIQYIYASFKFPSVNTLSNIYNYGLTVATVGLIMFAVLVKFTNQKNTTQQIYVLTNQLACSTKHATIALFNFYLECKVLVYNMYTSLSKAVFRALIIINKTSYSHLLTYVLVLLILLGCLAILH